MAIRTLVQSNEVSAIAYQDGTAEAGHKGKLDRIPDGLVRLSSVNCRKDIVAKLTQPFHNREWKILICVKPGHDAQASSFRRMASSISAGWPA